MKYIIILFVCFIALEVYSFDISSIESSLNPNQEYCIYDEEGQIVVKEIDLSTYNSTVKNIIVETLSKDSKLYTKYDLYKFGNFVKKLYEDKNIIINEYKQFDADSKDQLIQISLINKATKKEMLIMYKAFPFRNYPSFDNDPFNVYDVRVGKDNNILISFVSYYFLNVNVIEYENMDKNIIYDYNIPLASSDSNKIVSSKFISDNIIKVERETYNHNIKVDYFKIKQNHEDTVKNLSFRKSRNISENKTKVFNMKLLWSEYNKNTINENLSYDYFEQDEEPTIEQLKEKFPNDTFFSEPEAEQKSINNTTDTNSGLWQKITFWCRNIISKFTV